MHNYFCIQRHITLFLNDLQILVNPHYSYNSTHTIKLYKDVFFNLIGDKRKILILIFLSLLVCIFLHSRPHDSFLKQRTTILQIFSQNIAWYRSVDVFRKVG